MPDLTGDDDAIRGLLQKVHRIAMVGASNNPERPSYNVFRFLKEQGYDVVPVTPKPDPVHGIEPASDLKDALGRFDPEPIDLVDVFRRPDAVPEVVQQAIDADAKAIWFQLGVVNQEGIDAALDAGLEVVVDRCPHIEIPRLGLKR